MLSSFFFCLSFSIRTTKQKGFSGLNNMPDTDGQPYLTIPYTSQGFQNIFRTSVLSLFLLYLSFLLLSCFFLLCVCTFVFLFFRSSPQFSRLSVYPSSSLLIIIFVSPSPPLSPFSILPLYNFCLLSALDIDSLHHYLP